MVVLQSFNVKSNFSWGSIGLSWHWSWGCDNIFLLESYPKSVSCFRRVSVSLRNALSRIENQNYDFTGKVFNICFNLTLQINGTLRFSLADLTIVLKSLLLQKIFHQLRLSFFLSIEIKQKFSWWVLRVGNGKIPYNSCSKNWIKIIE